MTDVTTRYPQSLLAACLIPWTESYEFDVPVFESHVNKVIDLGYTNLYIMGTAAEGYAITDTRFKQVVESFASLIDRKGLSAQVGVISLSMEQVIERIGFAYDQGIRFSRYRSQVGEPWTKVRHWFFLRLFAARSPTRVSCTTTCLAPDG